MAMQESYSMTRDNLFAGTQVMPVVADEITIPAGKDYKRGAILTEAGELAGESNVHAILAHDVTTTDEPKKAAVYLTGEFNAAAMTASVDVASCKSAARKIGIFIKEAIAN